MPLVEMAPTAGLSDQATAVLIVPLTVAVNCWLCDAFTVALVGSTATVTGGIRLTVALADFVGSVVLVAVSVTVWVEVIVAGAV